jgi:hypothetical protein
VPGGGFTVDFASCRADHGGGAVCAPSAYTVPVCAERAERGGHDRASQPWQPSGAWAIRPMVAISRMRGCATVFAVNIFTTR